MVMMHFQILFLQKTNLQWGVEPKLFVYATMSRTTTGFSLFPCTLFPWFFSILATIKRTCILRSYFWCFNLVRRVYLQFDFP